MEEPISSWKCTCLYSHLAYKNTLCPLRLCLLAITTAQTCRKDTSQPQIACLDQTPHRACWQQGTYTNWTLRRSSKLRMDWRNPVPTHAICERLEVLYFFVHICSTSSSPRARFSQEWLVQIPSKVSPSAVRGLRRCWMGLLRDE